MNSGLNGVLPGAREMFSPALTPILLHSPSIRFAKQYTGFRRGLICRRWTPGNTIGFGLADGWYVLIATVLFVGVSPWEAG